ncbi:MAG: hypothetical protein K1X28_08930 [Parachlamydiales bacterium]|nr:hypothetical protein [Parachlamydiales bacterium]
MRSLNPWPVFPPNLEPPLARSLSIQFILTSLIDGFAFILKLQHSTPLKGGYIRKEVEALYQELQKILLFSLEEPMSQTGGFIDKLCFYSDILIQASQIKEPELFPVLEEIRKELLTFRSKMLVWKKLSASYPLEEMLEQLMQLTSHLFEHLRSYFRALVPFLRETRSDENLLIFLIENKQRLNRDLGPHCIEELLQSFFPAGHDQLRAVIYEGYTRRGFSEYFTAVEPLINELHWEAPCQSQNPL